MVRSIVLNSTHATSSSNRFTYRFPTPISFQSGEKIALASVQVPYSWYNIDSAKFNNGFFQYRWYSSPTSFETFDVIIPDGFYTVDQLNFELQSVMIKNKHYLIESNGNFLFFLEFALNLSKYGIQINSYSLNSIPPGASLPSGSTLTFPNFTPLIYFPNNNFYEILGYEPDRLFPASNPSNTQDLKSISTTTPLSHPVSSIIAYCDVADNELSIPSNQIYSFSPNVPFGSLINISPPSFAWVNLRAGQYNTLTISFLDDKNNPLGIRDKNVVITLLIRSSNEMA